MDAVTTSTQPSAPRPWADHPFRAHPGFRRMFAPGRLTVGVFLPLRFYTGRLDVLEGQADLVASLDRSAAAGVWVRDVPLFDPGFGDAGQVFDPFVYLAYLAARTEHIALATGSAIFTLRHPVDLAKAATSVDQLSGGRLVLGVASGDRPVEFPAYGIDHQRRGERFRDAVTMFRELTSPHARGVTSPLGRVPADVQLLPRPVGDAIPLVVTGSSGQTPGWIAEHADGWLTYPGPSTATPAEVRKLAPTIEAWRGRLPAGEFRPHITNEWIDLAEDPAARRTPMRNGFVLRTGRDGLLDLLHEWQEIGVNHAALGIQHGDRPPADVLAELAEEVFPHFPAHRAPATSGARW